MNLSESEGVFTGSNGAKLYYWTHRVASAPFRAVIAVIEAPHDSAGLYANLVERLADEGYTFYGYSCGEMRHLPGRTGFLEEWDEQLRTLDTFLSLVRVHEPDAPLFVAAEGVAGQLLLTYALHHPEGLRGVIALHPSLPERARHSRLTLFTRALMRIWPGFIPTTEARRPVSQHDLAPAPAEVRAGMHKAAPSPVPPVTTASDITIPVFVPGNSTENAREGVPVPPAGDANDEPIFAEIERWLEHVLASTIG